MGPEAETIGIEQVAVRLGRSVATIRRLAGAGKIPPQIPGLRGRWSAAGISAFIQGNGAAAAPGNKKPKRKR